jgi:hypothetical protein
MYRVYCGATNQLIDDVDHEHVAIAIATVHEADHHCGTWWERPFDHVGFYAPNVDPGRT